MTFNQCFKKFGSIIIPEIKLPKESWKQGTLNTTKLDNLLQVSLIVIQILVDLSMSLLGKFKMAR